jgi:hypothetical protein
MGTVMGSMKTETSTAGATSAATPMATVAVVGNTFFAGSLQGVDETEFLQVRRMLRAATVTLANLECAIPDPGTPPAFVAGSGWGATNMVGSPTMLDDLRDLGVDAVCAANNHVSDFGDAGILSTVSHLKSRGFPYAGIGASLHAASRAGYVDTPAFIVACDWGPRGSQGLGFPWPAGYFGSDDGPPFSPRPGVNLLRYSSTSHISETQMEWLREISHEQGWEQDKIYRRNGSWRSHPLVGMTTNLGVEVDTETEFWFLGRKFVVDGSTGASTTPCQEDLDRILGQVREAKQHADLVFVGLHDQSHGSSVHDYVSAFAHGAIESGADVYFSNGGSHMGVEIYRGKPICYGIPNFFLQTESVTEVPESAVTRYGLPPGTSAGDFLARRAACATRALAEGGPIVQNLGGRGGAIYLFDLAGGGHIDQVRIQPIVSKGGPIIGTENPDLPRQLRQLPLMPAPDDEIAREVLDYIVQNSKDFDTQVLITDGQATISCNPELAH